MTHVYELEVGDPSLCTLRTKGSNWFYAEEREVSHKKQLISATKSGLPSEKSLSLLEIKILRVSIWNPGVLFRTSMFYTMKNGSIGFLKVLS